MDAVRTAGSTCVVVQQADPGAGVLSYRFVPSSWYMGRTMHYATGHQFPESMSKSPDKELQHRSGHSNQHDMCVSYGGAGEDSGLLRCDAVLLGEWFPTFRRLFSRTDWPKALRHFDLSKGRELPARHSVTP